MLDLADGDLSVIERSAPRIVAQVAAELASGEHPAEIAMRLRIGRQMVYHYRAKLAAAVKAANQAGKAARRQEQADLAHAAARASRDSYWSYRLKWERDRAPAKISEARERALEKAMVRFGRPGPRVQVAEYEINAIADALQRQHPHRHPSRLAKRYELAIIARVEAATALSGINRMARSSAEFVVKRPSWTIVDAMGVFWRSDILAVAAVCNRLESQWLWGPADRRSPNLARLRNQLLKMPVSKGAATGRFDGWSWWAPFVQWLRSVVHVVPRGPMIHVAVSIRPPRERYAPIWFHNKDTREWTRFDFLRRRLDGVVLHIPASGDAPPAVNVMGTLDKLDKLSSENPRSWAGCPVLVTRLRNELRKQLRNNAGHEEVGLVLGRDELVSLWGVPLAPPRRAPRRRKQRGNDAGTWWEGPTGRFPRAHGSGF